MKARARNVIDGTGVMTFILGQVEESLAADNFIEMMKQAPENTWHGPRVLNLLFNLRSGRDIRITEDVLLAAVKNSISGNEITRIMLESGRELDITEKVLEAALTSLEFDGTMKALLRRAGATSTTEDMLIAAACNSHFSDELVLLLLDRAGDATATEEVVKAAAANEAFGREIILLLEKQYGEITIAEEVLKAAAATGGVPTVAFLLERDRSMKITEEIMQAAAVTGTPQVMRLLIEREETSKITQDCVNVASSNQRHTDMVKLLLDSAKDVEITDETLARAAGASYAAMEILEFLLHRSGKTAVPVDVIQGAMKNDHFASKLLSTYSTSP